MADDLSAAVTSCLTAFNTFVQLPQIDYFHNEVSPVLWRDELGRLRIWAGNIGAHQTGQSSLGYRLRDASHISNQILRLVRDLESTIEELEMLLLQKDNGSSRRDQEVDGAGSSMDAIEAELISKLVEEAESNSLTEVQRIYDDIVDIVNGLYKVSMLIRKPAARDRFLHRHERDAMGFEPFDINHVANKFPRLSEVVVRRIGSAITWRRRNLKYWERHHAKLEQGLDGLEDSQEALSQTVATEFKSSAVPVDDQGSDTGRSQTSYASSLIGGGAVSVPPRPKESLRGVPFQCPICYYIISIKDEDSWARHVFKDLMPYVCVYPDCSMPNKLYDSRHEWFDHEFRAHLRELTATENRVNDTSTEHRLLECPVCVSRPQRFWELERHIAKHLQEVALFVLPSTFDDEGDELSVQDKSEASEPIKTQDYYGISNVHAYIKNVNEKVPASELRSELEKYGELVYFDVSRSRSCAFVEFANGAGYNAAVAANPHTIGTELIIVEQRRPKPKAFSGRNTLSTPGGANVSRGKGSMQGRGGGSQGGASRKWR